MTDEGNKQYEPDHRPSDWTPFLFLLVLFFVLLLVIFPPKSRVIYFPDYGVRPAKDLQVSPLAGINSNLKDTELGSKINRIVESIYSDGDLRPIEEDLAEDKYQETVARNFSIIVDCQPAGKYIERVLAHLESHAKEIWGDKKTNLYFYDDRYVGLKSEVFSFSGGSIFFSTTVFLSVRNEAEVAAILSHERAHVVLRHTALKNKILKNIFGFEYRFAKNNDLAGREVLSMAKARIFGFWGIDGELHRTHEAQADYIGQIFLRRSDYNDLASVEFLPRLAMFREPDSVFLDNANARIASMKESGNTFKKETGYEGKDFVVSTPEEFKIVQDELRKVLNKL